MNENYIVINGKRLELTKEQLKTLGIEVRKNPFERVGKYEDYCCIKETGEIYTYYDDGGSFDNILYAESNYFNDKSFAEQIALHQLLYRKLLKFAYDNGFEDTEEWNGGNEHWAIRYNSYRNEFRLYYQDGYKAHEVYFSSEEGAERAIKEVVKPFMKEHPEFVW